MAKPADLRQAMSASAKSAPRITRAALETAPTIRTSEAQTDREGKAASTLKDNPITVRAAPTNPT